MCQIHHQKIIIEKNMAFGHHMNLFQPRIQDEIRGGDFELPAGQDIPEGLKPGSLVEPLYAGSDSVRASDTGGNSFELSDSRPATKSSISASHAIRRCSPGEIRT